MTRKEGIERLQEYIVRALSASCKKETGAALANRFVFLWALMTRIPLPASVWPRGVMPGGADALTMAPLVGAALGMISAAPAVLLSLIVPSAPCAWIACGIYVICGWSLHLDGWGDLWDGIGSGKSGEAMRTIMKDSRSGSFGVSGIVLAISIRASLLASIPAELWLPACAAAGGAGRFACAASAYVGRYPWEAGMARDYVNGFQGYQFFCAFLAALPLLLLSPAGVAAGLLLTSLTGISVAFWANKRLDGVNGDVLGAAAVLGELLVMIVCAA